MTTIHTQGIAKLTNNSSTVSNNKSLNTKGQIPDNNDKLIENIVYNNNISVTSSIQPLKVTNVPTQPSLVTTTPGDRRIFMQRRNSDDTLSAKYSITMKGVNWGPASVGNNPAWNPEEYKKEYSKWFKTDLPLMAKMGINTVRVYHDFGTGSEAMEILDECYKHGINVIMTVDSPKHGVVADLANIPTIVNAYKNHPAILMWAVGNEWDINFYYNKFSNLADSLEFTENAASLIKTLDTNHPVTTFTADLLSNKHLSKKQAPWNSGPFMEDFVNVNIPSVDVWGINVYRNASFGDVFSQWSTISTKPMFIGEFGADSYSHINNSQDETTQNNFNLGLYNEVHYNLASERKNGISSGSLVFEWNDEWWKSGSPTVHNISSEINYGQPDNHNDEEHFGLVNIHRQPKATYYGLKNIFSLNGHQLSATNPNPTLTITSRNPAVWPYNGVEIKIDDKVVYARGGGAAGGRGFVVAIFDKETGTRMKDYKYWDTWTTQTDEYPEIINYLNSVPSGDIIAMGVSDSAWFSSAWISALDQHLQGMGSTKIQNADIHDGWAMIVQKGGAVLSEDYAQSEMATAQKTFTLTTNTNSDRREPITEVIPFKITSLNKQNKIDFESQRGVVYTIEYCDDLKTNAWKVAQRGVIAETNQTSWTDDGSVTDSLPESRFYRINATDRVMFVE